MRLKKRWILLLVVAAVTLLITVLSRGPSVDDGTYLVVDIKGEYSEGPPRRGLIARILEDRRVLLELLDNLRKARYDKRIEGVVAHVHDLDAGWAQVQDLRDSLLKLKKAGKHVVAFLDANSFGANREYYLASAADEVYVPPGGAPMLKGLSSHYVFLGGVWEKIDIDMEVEQIREYKTAGDMIARRGMSNAHREVANSVLDDINEQFIGGIAEARGLEAAEVQAIVDACPASPNAFVEEGLADGVKYFDELHSSLAPEDAPPLLFEEDYTEVDASSVGIETGPRIAVIHASGNIIQGKGSTPSIMGMTIGSQTLTEAFADAVADETIRAIVFRVDSPGGSPFASDEVWRQVRLAREVKPVVASLANVAASGGYYMAVAADRIVAQGISTTGSIGVVMFKPNIAGLLGRLGIGSESLVRGRYAGLMDISKGLDRAELSLIRTQMDRTYELFLERVAEGRGMSVEEVDELAGGRVWTGMQALHNGLVDELGGLEDAVTAAARAAAIDDPQSVRLVYFPKRGLLSYELAKLKGRVGLRAALPDPLARHLATALGALALRPGVQALATTLPAVQ
ncbi:MAG: signal peptide peptidase SppA [Candidatus Binatia bacterium]